MCLNKRIDQRIHQLKCWRHNVQCCIAGHQQDLIRIDKELRQLEQEKLDSAIPEMPTESEAFYIKEGSSVPAPPPAPENVKVTSRFGLLG